ncbi:hypothetical protein Plhal304r1_c009g0036711 [Plasmopara halstedii]
MESGVLLSRTQRLAVTAHIQKHLGFLVECSFTGFGCKKRSIFRGSPSNVIKFEGEGSRCEHTPGCK